MIVKVQSGPAIVLAFPFKVASIGNQGSGTHTRVPEKEKERQSRFMTEPSIV